MDGLHKENITVDTLLNNESFQNFVLKKDAGDIDFWNKWLKNNPDKSEVAGQAASILSHLSFRDNLVGKETIDREWERVVSAIDSEKTSFLRHDIVKLYHAWQKIAAVILFPVLIFSGLFLVHEYGKNKNQYTCVYTQDNRKNKVILPDSTVVFLNAGSSIMYSGKYNRRERNIILTGEGYFDVAKNPGKPFRVTTQDHVITALGTRFTVRNYENEDYCQVILVEGKVCFESKERKEKTMMDPGDKLSFMKKSAQITLSRPSLEVETAWINNTLIVENDSFITMIRKLENWFDVNIHLTGPAMAIDSRYRMRLKTESLKESLDLINYVIPIEYKIDGDEVFISVKK